MSNPEVTKNVTRADLASMKRILIKVGTSIVAHSDGSAALSRVASIVEQVSDLHRSNKQVIIVTSGAGALGRRKIKQALSRSNDLNSITTDESIVVDKRAAAAAGQSSLMSMYESLFGLKELACSQILLTDSHFILESGRTNLRNAINALLDLRIVPLINENDVTSIGGGVFSGSEHSFWDNDSMASLICRELSVDLAIFLTDVEGLCRFPPTADSKPDVIHTFVPGVTNDFKLGTVSKAGRGGMQAKVEAAISTLKYTKAVVIASGYHHNTVAQILSGETIGTFFTATQDPVQHIIDSTPLVTNNIITTLAMNAKKASLSLQSVSATHRTSILFALAEALLNRKQEILEANQQDLELAKANNLSSSMYGRLVLSESKLQSLVAGIRQIAESVDPIGHVISSTELATGLILNKASVPIGVLLVIFESRPDVLPQVAALAIRSGNGLILKGGKEAINTNKVLIEIIGEAIESVPIQTVDSKKDIGENNSSETTKHSNGNGIIDHNATSVNDTYGCLPNNDQENIFISRSLISLVDSREAVSSLLELDKYINLVIPRGSSDLVKFIQRNTKIPVLGHADGICHVYVDVSASLDKAISIVLDAKTDYPAACNAAETLLIHKDWPKHNVEQLCLALRQAKVELLGGPKAVKALDLNKAINLSTEYGSLTIAVEIVENLEAAIAHINQHSSSHTEAIVTEDQESAAKFLTHIDSACVFHNASTRFADGYRFGLGAEVGISTSRIHARGPVGIEGLLTTKWTLQSDQKHGETVSSFSKGLRQYTHKKLQ